MTSSNSSLIDGEFLDDLASRFIINVPVEERSNLIRICFQIEQAHWFYLDFFCSQEDDRLVPCGIKQFAVHIFKHVPFLRPHVPNLTDILENWKKYKLSVPTYGAILISEDLSKVLLVQSFWAKSSWGFPKGKVNENEDPVHCAVREVFEETGFDISHLIMPHEYFESIFNYQFTRLYVVCNVPGDTDFTPRTRNEIKSCEWFPIDLLPNNKTDVECKAKLGVNANSFFMIMPFIKKLKKWVFNRKEQWSDSRRTRSEMKNQNKRQRHKSMGDIENLWPGATSAANNTAAFNDSSLFMQSGSKAMTVAKCGTSNQAVANNKFTTPTSASEAKRHREKVNKSNIKRQLFGPDLTSTPEHPNRAAFSNFSFANFPVVKQQPQSQHKNTGAKVKNQTRSHYAEVEEKELTGNPTKNFTFKPFQLKPVDEWDNFKFDMDKLAKCLIEETKMY